MKKLALILFVVVPLKMAASDITQGHIFQPAEQNITHVEMNAIVGSATINTTFFTDKAALAPAAADVFLYYSAANAAYRKATLTQLLLSDTLLITSQSQDTSPSGTDFVLTFDGTTFRKVTLQDLIGGTTNFMQTFPEITTPLLTDYIPISENSSNRVVTVSNFLALTRTTFDYSTAFTNLPAHTTPTNNDKLLIWDSTTFSNKQITVVGLLTNLGTVSAVSGTDLLPIVSSGTNVATTTLNTISNSIVSGLLTTNSSPIKFTSAEMAIPGGNTPTNIAHGLPGIPQSSTWVIVCKTAEHGYVVGDEIPSVAVLDSSTSLPAFTSGVNATNMFIIQQANMRVFDKNTAASSALTAASWRLKAYAIYFP